MGFDVYGKSGNYFRANIWSWRPILDLIRQVNKRQKLNLNLDGWGCNDGNGLHTQAECDALASALEKATSPNAVHSITVPGAPLVNDDGLFLAPGEAGGKSPYYTDGEHILEFCKFLRECGGEFAIN